MADLFDRFESDVGHGQAGGWRQERQQAPANPFQDVDISALQSVSYLRSYS